MCLLSGSLEVRKPNNQSLVVLLSAVAVCEKGAEPLGLSSHHPATVKLKGKAPLLSSGPLGACQGHHMPPVSPLIKAKLNPLKTCLFTAFHSQRLQGSCLLLVKIENTQKSCPFVVMAQKEYWGQRKLALGKIRDGVGFSLGFLELLAFPGPLQAHCYKVVSTCTF